jgi:thermitase
MDRVGRRQFLLGSALGGVAVALGGSPAVAGAAGVGRSAPAVFPEYRTTARIGTDMANAARQVEALSSATAQARVSQIIDRLRARQDAAPSPYGVPFDRYLPGAPGTEVLVARGQLVVRMDRPAGAPAADSAAHAEAVIARLAALGYARVGDASKWLASALVAGTQASPGPGVGVFGGVKAPADLARDAASLRAQGIVAAMNVVVPLGYVVKAEDYPMVTEQSVAAPVVARAPVRVALIDTGVAAAPRGDGWLRGAVVGPGNADPLDVLPVAGRLDWGAGHGTFTAGVVQRVAPRCEIVAYRYTNSDGVGTDADVADMLLRAARDAYQAGVRTIINASLGTPAADGVPPALQAAVEFIVATYPSVLIVASAGNLGSDQPVYPAAFDGVVAVGALTDDLRPAPFSSHGSWVDCSTVGVGVVSTFPAGVSPPEPDPAHPDQVFGPDAWALWSGTSFSAPQISGAVARLCCDRPWLSPRGALDLLLERQPTLPGYGRVLRLLPGTPTP